MRDFATKLHILNLCVLLILKIAFEVSMKCKKSPSAYVLNLRIRLNCSAMFLFNFADSYDVKEDSKHTCLVLGTGTKYFHATQVRPSRSQNFSF